MKKLVSILSVLTLLLSTSISPLTANAVVKDDYDIVVGTVENTKPLNSFSRSSNKTYTLDFSCLNVEFKDGKILSKPDLKKIENVSKVKDFNKEKSNMLLSNALETKELLDSTFNDPSTQREIIEIIQQNLKETSQMPIISMTEANFQDNTDPFNISPRLSGEEEGTTIKIYTSVSGSGSSVWGQSNVYVKYPTTMGAQLYCKDNISLSWDSPWKISNNYTLKLVGTLGETLTKDRIRTGGANNCLAFSFAQSYVQGAYLGATLNDGTSGGHNLFSKYIRTNMNLSYSFSGNSGKTGVTVSPTLGTSSIDSHVYFTN